MGETERRDANSAQVKFPVCWPFMQQKGSGCSLVIEFFISICVVNDVNVASHNGKLTQNCVCLNLQNCFLVGISIASVGL